MTVEPKYVDNPPSRPVDLDPFARFNWKTAESRDMFKGPMTEFAHAKSEVEWRSVLDGQTDRKAAIIHVNNYNRDSWIKRVGDFDLHFRAIRYSKPYDGFSHRHFDTTIDDPTRITYAVVAQNKDVADKMFEAETEMVGHERHDVVGELLGFPKCCRTHFNGVWVDNHDRGLWDPMYEIACNSPSTEIITDRENIRVVEPNAYTNILWRYFGWSFITHMPCSFECEEAARIGKQRHDLMNVLGYADAAQTAYEWLDSPAVWDGLHSIANIRNMHVTGTAGTSSYWSKKRIEWRHEHLPQMKAFYTAEDLAKINV